MSAKELENDPSLTAELYLNNRIVTLRHTNAGDHIYHQIVKDRRFYEEELLKAIAPLITENDLVIDAGANIGNHSIYWSISTGCRVISFEPIPEIFDLLTLNIRDNKLEDRVFAKNFALGKAIGKASIDHFDPMNFGATSLAAGGDEASIRLRALDSVSEIRTNRIRLLKIDVEGMELDVIEGAVNTIKRDLPIVICECSTDRAYNSVLKSLSSYGYYSVECFNATATYVFFHQSEKGSDGFSLMRYLVSGIERASSQNQRLRELLNRQRRMFASIEKRILALEDHLLVQDSKDAGVGSEQHVED